MINASVLDLARHKRDTWQDRDEAYWLAMLMEEVGELAAALYDEHEDPPEWELMQIASLCLNWLRKRDARRICANLYVERVLEEKQ